MLALFRSPRWIALGVIIVVAVGVFVRLGFWQLERHRQRVLENQVLALRLKQPPVDLTEALAAAGSDLDTLEYRPVTVVGEYVPSEERLIRSQVRNGQAGYGVLTPLQLESGGEVVMILRGWVPLELDEVPVTQAPPPDGVVEATGLARLSQERPAIGRQSEPGAAVVSRVDLNFFRAELSQQVLPLWIELIDDGSDPQLPLPGQPPDFEDQGPHLAYAFQWFGFAVIAVVGFGFLLRRAAGESG